MLEAEIKLCVRIPRSLDEVKDMPHRLTLTSDDGTVTVTVPASEAEAGDVDGTSTVTFTGLAEHHSYTLSIDNGSDPAYQIFAGEAYEQIGEEDGDAGATMRPRPRRQDHLPRRVAGAARRVLGQGAEEGRGTTVFLLAQLTKIGDVRAAVLTPNYQAGVDAFFRSAAATYTTPADIPTGAAAGTVIAAPTFMMNPGYPDQQTFKAGEKKTQTLHKLGAGAGLSSQQLDGLLVGRAPPSDVQAITQALINAQPASMTLLNTQAKVWQPLDVRRIMFDHAIGFDCAGYVQQAYLRATGRSRGQLGWDSLGNEGLLNLAGNGFRRFDKMADLRPGDIIAFNPKVKASGEPGHRTIVFDQRQATDDDKSAVASASGGADYAAAGAFRVLEMDSSYGAWGFYYRGGVQRQTWLFNGKQWANLILQPRDDPDFVPTDARQLPPSRALVLPGGLYGFSDVMEGFYRFRAD